MIKKLSGLYVITNEDLMPEALFLDMAKAAIQSGASVLQYRDKSSDKSKRLFQAKNLKTLCDKHHVIFIINDDIDLAKQVDADGIHIGKDDLSIKEARKRIGPNKIIGVSCYNQITLATEAINHGADYIAFGSFFGSSIKPEAPQATSELIPSLKLMHNTPVCCIGGITLNNQSQLLKAGADMLAVISDIFSQTDNAKIASRCQQYKKAFNDRIA